MACKVWNLQDNVARLSCDGLDATLDLSRPDRGLHNLQCAAALLHQPHGVALNAELLGVDVNPVSIGQTRTLVDAYVRGSDLVATYEQCPERPLRVQIYWRAIRDSNEQGPPAIDLHILVQTDLLGTPPAIAVHSHMPIGSAWRLSSAQDDAFTPVELPTDVVTTRPQQAPGCWLVRSERLGISYAEMIHPADFYQAHLAACTAPDAVAITHTLFGSGELEKGVILRARLRGRLMPSEGDMAATARSYQQLLTAALPLTV